MTVSDRYESRASTHAADCWSWGPKHYECAVREIEALRAEVSELRAARIAYASEFPATKDGGPDTENIHTNIRSLKARAERLAVALRELEEREQRDEALLRQALEALSRAHQTAMVQTLKARIPECAEFGGIAQDLDFVVTTLRDFFAAKTKGLMPRPRSGT